MSDSIIVEYNYVRGTNKKLVKVFVKFLRESVPHCRAQSCKQGNGRLGK
jgi:hypothetical protein